MSKDVKLGLGLGLAGSPYRALIQALPASTGTIRKSQEPTV